jgi:metal-responsive CopG/Arc/MetJ family transcriptional regulator
MVAQRQEVIGVSVSQEFLERLEQAARKASMSRSAYVKAAVAAYLHRLGENGN